jgi:SRSO17 transposase
MLASDRPTRGRIGQHDQIQLFERPADTPQLQLAQMQGQRYWVERAFEDGKGECGLADYQALGWRSCITTSRW